MSVHKEDDHTDAKLEILERPAAIYANSIVNASKK